MIQDDDEIAQAWARLPEMITNAARFQELRDLFSDLPDGRWRSDAIKIIDDNLDNYTQALEALNIHILNCLRASFLYCTGKGMDFGLSPQEEANIRRLFCVVWAYFNRVDGHAIDQSLPNKCGLDMAHAIGTLIEGRHNYEIDDEGQYVTLSPTDPVEAGKKWLSRLRQQNRDKPARNFNDFTGVNSMSYADWISLLLRHLPSMRGRPKSDSK